MDWLKKLLEDAQIKDGKLDIEALMGAVNTEFPKHAVPKDKYNELATAKAGLDEQLKDRDKQLDELKKVDAAGLQAKIAELQEQNKTVQADFEGKLKAAQLDYALEARLLKEGAVNTKAVRALLDSAKISLDGENLVGLDDQLAALKESEKWAFGGTGDSAKTKVKTGNPHSQGGGEPEPTVRGELKQSLFGKTE